MKRTLVVVASSFVVGCGAAGAAPGPENARTTGVENADRSRSGHAGEGAEFLAAGMHTTQALRLAPHERRLIHVTASRGIVDVDLDAYDDAGRLIATDRAPDATPIVAIAGGTDGGTVFVVARVVDGAGTVGIASAPLADSASPDLRLPASPSAQGELGRPAVATEDVFLQRAGLATLRHDRPVELEAQPDLRIGVSLEAGHCLGAFVATETSTPIEISLLASDGHSLARAIGPEGRAIVAHCAEGEEDLALAVRSARPVAARLVVREGRRTDISGIEALIETSARNAGAPSGAPAGR